MHFKKYIDKCQCGTLKEFKYRFCRHCMDRILKLDEQYKRFLKKAKKPSD